VIDLILERLAMRLVSFEIAGAAGYGTLQGDTITRIDTLPGAAPDLKTAIERDQVADLRSQAGASTVSLADVQLLPPIPNPAKILCVATNYREPHNADAPLPEFPIVFTRFADSFTGHAQPLIKPTVSEMFDFEGELAVIIGRHGFKIPNERAHEHVAGFSCLNDGSARDWQRHTAQFTPGKNFYRSGSVGPWIVTPDEMPDFSSSHLRTTVNGGHGLHLADELALLGISTQQDAGGAEVGEALDDRVVRRPAGATGPTREDHVQAEVARLREQWSEHGQRVALRGGDEVVVVDEDEALGAGPPRPGAQLLR
jgi:2-keto-4-pentenoate hydratase/2-oxohepta-3-ene-1,7-dioic acid hydratase in catechol pathway